MKYQVTENNGGGLTLYVWDDDGSLVYAHAGYEYVPGQLTEDIAALTKDGNTDGWEGNDLENEEMTEGEYYDDHETTRVIADQDGPIPEDKMGRAGQREFYPGKNEA